MMIKAKYILGKKSHVAGIFETHTLTLAPPGTAANLTGVRFGVLSFAADQSEVCFTVTFPWPVTQHVFQPLAGDAARKEKDFLPTRTTVIKVDATGEGVHDVLRAVAKDKKSGAAVNILVEDGAISNY